MTSFQVILIVALGTLLLATIIGILKQWASRGLLVAWAVLWILGMAAAIWPDSTTSVANALGIRRGTDLLLYCTTIVMLAGFFMLYVRLRRVRRDLTVLTRRLAIMDAHENPLDDADQG